MPVAYKDVMVAGTTSTGTYATLYSTNSTTTAIISNLSIANESTTPLTVRVGAASSAVAPASGSFYMFDVTVPANDTLSIGPIAVGPTRFIRVSSSAATCTFAAAVAEVT